ncbi:MAG: carbohydrate porin [Alphaproteobacteria bacterium]|nr:carbohydrate porin [Alphaproteobacteria bacterium]MBU6472145.1 carbohydrate porin [Alphaproteobacteria bacterium]MDE2014559.1 carbohydrate porin [Alphaproteobacteria bacterium]MDE2072360.1 carbohydrate porin [Alphaproteobacteria bacterium]MDE2351557.1 carbohydrate porin [Alphaproteobacteria bacterium]
MAIHSRARSTHVFFGAVGVAVVMCAPAAAADSGESWSLYGQMTLVEQYHPAFRSPYRGANSLDPGSRGNETFDMTAYAGVRLWPGGELYANPEIDQGFGLSNTLGVAGYPSGEAYKVGSSEPYFRLQRLFFRQTFDLGGAAEAVTPGANQLGATRSADNLVITLGKFSVTDIFDTNRYAHDPRGDFLNWSVIDAGAFDYAADAWGYSYGVAAEWTQSWWTLRAGLFDLSRVPNTTALERGFGQFELVAEVEERQTLWGEPGKLKLLGFLNRGRMGSYADAVRLAQRSARPPDTGLVRRYGSRPGLAIILEQQIANNLGLFFRASLNDGSKEAYEFTEVNRSLSAGVSLDGVGWGRPDDVVGVSGVINALPVAAQRYFAAGGMGILIGDGRLPRYGTEDIAEVYYRAQVTEQISASVDYQFVAHPAYNRDRGPVSIFGLRLHAEI